MTECSVVYTNLSNSEDAGTYLGSEIFKNLAQQSPDVVIVFASSIYDYLALLQAIERTCRPRIMVGCSSAGEFINGAQGEGSASAVAIRSTEIQFAAGLGNQLRTDRDKAARQIVSSFTGLNSHNYLYHSALVLTDALAGHADDLVEQLNLLTAGTYSLFGGGAGDDAQFSRTHVFFGTNAYPDAAVALEILSNKPLGVGVSHGWKPASAPMRITEAEGMRLISLNAAPALEALQEHADLTRQKFNVDDPLPFFLHNVIGIDMGDGYKLRVPLSINSDGSVSCAADIPTGATACIMSATASSSADAATRAIQSAVKQLDGGKPKVALFFDCVATRLRMGGEFGLEMQAIQNALGAAPYVGCNTYGQIARADGQFNGFHNCTATVCVIPE
jgi:hypothetical protein